MNPDQCPADIEETAEAYLQDRLAPQEREAFEDHYITCDSCAKQLQSAEEFRGAIQRAAGLLKDGASDAASDASAAPVCDN